MLIDQGPMRFGSVWGEVDKMGRMRVSTEDMAVNSTFTVLYGRPRRLLEFRDGKAVGR